MPTDWLGYLMMRPVYTGVDMASDKDTGTWVVWCRDCDVAVMEGTGPAPSADEILAAHPHPRIAAHVREGGGESHTMAVRGRVTEGSDR